MEAADKSKIEGIIVMLLSVLDPPQAWGIEAVLETDNNEEPGVGRIDHRPGDASSIHASRLLHRRRGQSHCARAPRREDVHPQHQ